MMPHYALSSRLSEGSDEGPKKKKPKTLEHGTELSLGAKRSRRATVPRNYDESDSQVRVEQPKKQTAARTHTQSP